MKKKKMNEAINLWFIPRASNASPDAPVSDVYCFVIEITPRSCIALLFELSFLYHRRLPRQA